METKMLLLSRRSVEQPEVSAISNLGRAWRARLWGARAIFSSRVLTWLLIAFVGHSAHALEFKTVTHGGKQFIVCHVDPRADKLHLFLRDNSGQYLKSFDGIDRALAPRGERLLFGMNAGMFHPGLVPVGWFVTGGREVAPITLTNGDGNFFLKPNGVFLLTASGARVMESSRAAALADKVELATQSGPLLVIGGKIHPAFHPQSDSALFRNGVGVAGPHDVFFAISEGPVNFYQFATLFRDTLHCPDALFLDGTVSSLHSPELNRSDKKIDLGPMIGVIGPLPKTQP
jgi:uncharacterized protein YigE (DUF2233 family)